MSSVLPVTVRLAQGVPCGGRYSGLAARTNIDFHQLVLLTCGLGADTCCFSHWQTLEEVGTGLETPWKGDQATGFYAVRRQTPHSKCHVLSPHISFNTLEFAIQLFCDYIRGRTASLPVPDGNWLCTFGGKGSLPDNEKENICLFVSTNMREKSISFNEEVLKR